MEADYHIIRELTVHGLAYIVAASLGAVILYRYYWFFEWNTDDAGQARQAYLASVAIAGGIGPGLTLLLFWPCRLQRKRRVD